MQRISKLYTTLANLACRAPAAGLARPEMPDLSGLPVLGALTSLLDVGRGRRLHEYIDERHQRHGPLFRIRLGPVHAVFVGAADTARDVFHVEGPMPKHFLPEAWTLYNELRARKRGLLFMDGEEWLQHRRVLNKIMLAPDSPAMMSKPCLGAAEDLVERWKSYTSGDRVVPDLEDQLYQWSIEVLLATLVGSPWPAYRRSILEELGPLSRSLGRIFEHTVDLSRLPARLAMRLGLPSWRGFVETADRAFETVGRFVAQIERLDGADGLLARMAHDGIRGDMLQRIVVDLVLAAGDTTAYSMQWLMFLMSSDLEAQQRIRESLSGLDAPEVLRNQLLRGAIKESLRLYPTAPFLTRILPQDTLLGGYPTYRGELVVVSLYSCGRDEANFPRAQEFRPERWLRNEKGIFEGVINPNATLPFAIGARSCVGRRLAETQMSLTMAEILKHFSIDCLNKKNIKMKLRMISAPSEPLQLQLTPRY